MTRACVFALILALFAGQVFGAVDDAYTVSLLHFDSGFADESGKTWSVNGAIATSTAPKFGAQCMYLDGASWIETASSTDFEFLASYSIDFWVKFPTNPAQYVALVDTGNYATSNGVYLQIRDFNTSLNVFSNAQWKIAAPNVFSLNTWYHVAVTRDDSMVRLFVNGTMLAQTADTTAVYSVLPLKVGREVVGPLFANAYFDELRISKGTPRWVASFTPPTSAYSAAPDPITPIEFAAGGVIDLAPQHSVIAPDGTPGLDSTSTVCLLHFDGDYSDEAGTSWTSTNAAIESAKFGTGSFKGDGTVRYISCNGVDTVGPWTLDFWYRPTVTNGTGTIWHQMSGGSLKYRHLWFRADGKLELDVNYIYTPPSAWSGEGIVGNATLATGTWSHFLVGWDGSTYRVFQNGTLIGSQAGIGPTISSISFTSIGAFKAPLTSVFESGTCGDIDEMRIISGVCNFTTDFTAPARSYGPTILVGDIKLR